MTLWDIRIEDTGEIREGLSIAELRDLLSVRRVLATDWARPDPIWPWRQLSTWDEFSDITHAQRRRRKVRDDADEEMDMTPMIDVTFLLLIFFMITASFELQKGLSFPPEKTKDPQSSQQQAPGLADLQRDRLVLKLGRDDSFRLLDENQVAGDVIAPDDLVDRLRQKSQQSKKHQLLILPHDFASHEALVLAIDASARAGITQVSVADILDTDGS